MKYYVYLIVIGILTMFLSGLVAAQDNGNGNHGSGNGRGRNADPGVLPNGNLDPDYRQQFPSESSTVVNLAGEGEISALGLCDAITLNRSSNLYAYSNGTRHQAYSTVRAYTNPTYPCDIARVGARARIWSNSYLLADTSMLNSYNSADKTATAFTTPNVCSSTNKLGRGNHEFQQGTSSYSYITEGTSCGNG